MPPKIYLPVSNTIKMTKQNTLKLFEDKKVRIVWDSEQEKWYVSIVDVITVLTETRIRKYIGVC